MQHSYKTRGTCASNITFDINDGKVSNIKFTGGCNGNLKAISKLCEGKDIAYGYDFYLTSYKINFPILSCLVYDGSLIAYLPDNKNIKECKEHIEKYLSNNSITGIKVYVLDNKDKFLDRFTNIPSDYVQNDSDRSAFALIKNLSL